MLYIGTDYQGKEVRGHEMWADLSGAWIREETDYGYTETRVDPNSVKEIDEDEQQKSNKKKKGRRK